MFAADVEFLNQMVWFLQVAMKNYMQKLIFFVFL